MKKISKILCPTDFSDNAQNAFCFALWFADHFQAELQLLHGIYPEPEPADMPSIAFQATQEKIKLAKEMSQLFIDTSMAKLQAVYTLQEAPVIHTEVEIGTPVSVIAKASEEPSIDLIVMGTKGKHNAYDKVFGSNASGTIQRAACPVLVVPENVVLKRMSKLVFATDLDKADPYHIWEVIKLLHPFEPTAQVVHIAPQAATDQDFTMSDLKEFFKDIAPSLPLTFQTIVADEVVPALSDALHDWQADVLVMVKPHRKFFERLFHASLTKKMALELKVPLLIMR